MSQYTGIVKIYVGSTLHESMPGAELDLGGYEREMMVGHAVYGHKEKLMQSVCTFTLAHTKLSLDVLRATVDDTLRFECDSGVTYLVSKACVTKTLKVKGEDGTTEVEMQGAPAVEE